MKQTTYSLPLAFISAALLGAVALPAASLAQAQVPASLVPTDTERAAFTWKAVGTQNYECRTEAGKTAWVFVAPDADLLNDKNEKVGSHGAGPHWMALDGSKIVGTVKARAAAPTSTDIPHLLLTTKLDSGAGKMSNITSIQRLNTRGGIAQTGGCESAQDVGKSSKVGYTADYVFFTAK